MERTFLLAFLFQLFFWFVSLGCRYEKLGRRHTMCLYAPRSCPNSRLIRSGGLTKEDKDLILTIHNRLRSDVASGKISGLPAAADMRVMTWDDELAAIAQRWADRCTEGHDELRNTEKYSVGQNVARKWWYEHEDPKYKDKPEWPSTIEMWSSEYKKYRFPAGHITPFVFQYNVGHWTQIVWADTDKIGCGYSYYKHRRTGYTKKYVCNYGPAGNVMEGTMYKPSPRGARCIEPSLTLSKKNHALCEKRRNYRIRRRHASSHKKRTFESPRRFIPSQHLNARDRQTNFWNLYRRNSASDISYRKRS